MKLVSNFLQKNYTAKVVMINYNVVRHAQLDFFII